IKGAYMALLSREARAQVLLAAEKMTYVELSADNTFYDAFTAALFLPHTEIARFPSVATVWEEANATRAAHGLRGVVKGEGEQVSTHDGGSA
ncbi:MAG TPA: ASKHA domain-containing protein, partial [Anaerolineales bacterium]|nr:ASKHA domain-containing protein [Anaerolineales bacterium]